MADNNSYTSEPNDRICPNSNCQYDHHVKDANFCILCGTLLYYRCEDCTLVNPRYARFCFYCGSNISDIESTVPYDPDLEDNMNVHHKK